MPQRIWELRFIDGRGASFFTAADVTEQIGKTGVVLSIEVATQVFKGSAVADARKSLAEGRTQLLMAHMGAVAFALLHE